MKKIDVQKLFEYYNDTLNKCGSFVLEMGDDEIAYNVFEEFDIGIHSFFYIDNLEILFNEGYISFLKKDKSLKLREKVIQLQDSDNWNMIDLKTSKKWLEIFHLCDELKEII